MNFLIFIFNLISYISHLSISKLLNQSLFSHFLAVNCGQEMIIQYTKRPYLNCFKFMGWWGKKGEGTGGVGSVAGERSKRNKRLKKSRHIGALLGIVRVGRGGQIIAP